MSFTKDWPSDWNICKEDFLVSEKIVPIFESYLQSLKEKGVSKSTFNRHKGSCHSLGGYIIREIFNHDDNPFKGNETGQAILLHFLNGYDGPLIHPDNETCQREVDTTCKKLYKALKSNEI